MLTTIVKFKNKTKQKSEYETGFRAQGEVRMTYREFSNGGVLAVLLNAFFVNKHRVCNVSI